MAYNNTVAYASKYLDMLDRVYKASAATSILEPAANMYKFDNIDEKTVYIKTITAEGLADYNRSTGYDDGDLTIAWAAHTFSKDRGKRFLLDTQDQKEAYTQMAEVGAEFQRVYVSPEIDASRFEKMCSLAGTTATPATLTYDTVIAAIRTAIKTLDDAQVPKENRVLFVSSETEQNMEDSGEFIKTINVTQNNGVIDTSIKVFNNMPVVPVSADRFYTDFDFGSTGFTVAAGGKVLNFVIAYKPAALAIVKYKTSNIIDAAANQTADGYILKYRIYHDCFVPANKVNGIYVHKKA
jgi:hypothetical protein